MKTDSEACDDGNTADGDGCSSLCVPEAGSKCTHKAAEEAARRRREDEERAQQKLPPKPHSHADTEYGISWCRPVTCGDGAFDTSDDGSKVEQCDDGNSEDGDGCDGSCRIEAGARCEDNRDGQKSRCAKVVCGDSKVESSHDAQVNEECDDGNTNDGDGCSSSCAVVGGFLCMQEYSHDRSECREVVCGDFFRDTSNDGSRIEMCDDDNKEDGDGCSSSCKVEDGYICSGEPGGRWNNGGSKCSKVTCGDGFRESSGEVSATVEKCDDANDRDLDGCSSACTVEDGYECQEVPDSDKRLNNKPDRITGPVGFVSGGRDKCSRKTICGDGFRVGKEACDDGNTADADGCSSSCEVEEGYKCAAPRDTGDKPSPSPGEPLPDVCVKKPPKKEKEAKEL